MTQKTFDDFTDGETKDTSSGGVVTAGDVTGNPAVKYRNMYREMHPDIERNTIYTDAPSGDEDWFCPWCSSRNIVASPFRPFLWVCADCEAPQPVECDWYPELLW